jgi:hypothetical protein
LGATGKPKNKNIIRMIRHEEKKKRFGIIYLSAKAAESIPFQPRKDIANEEWVQLCLNDLELGVAGVQREGGVGGLACLTGAGEEIEREDLHVDKRSNGFGQKTGQEGTPLEGFVFYEGFVGGGVGGWRLKPLARIIVLRGRPRWKVCDAKQIIFFFL